MERSLPKRKFPQFPIEIVRNILQMENAPSFQENDVKLYDGFLLEIIAATPPDTPPT